MRASLMTRDLDPRMTFETFVVGPANRLATAAARRAADSPGTSYNPLFIYSPSGLGKTHILHAIAHHVGKMHPDAQVVYQTMEGYLDDLADALEEGERDALKDEYADLDILLLDDVQFLSGQPEAQELLLRTLDSLSVSGSQIALAGDRPPAEINDLDDRLLSRFSGGLIVDIAAPEYETRVAIIRRKSDERDASLEDGVAEAIARNPFKNVRELGGALNRVLAVQDLEERRVSPDEVPELIGVEEAGDQGGSGDEYGDFVSEVSADLESTVESQEEAWRVELRETAEAAEADGYRTGRLRRLLDREEEPPELEEVLERFRAAVDRLKEIEREMEEVGNPWPDAAATVVSDPERLEEAESLLASARERARPFRSVPDGPLLGGLADRIPPLALKAASRLIDEPSPEYNPLFVWDPEGEVAREVLEATARSFVDRHGEGRVALISASEFAEEFIEALSAGVAGAWRERWWDADLLLVHGLEALSRTERAQDEFFHLFEALRRREARVALAADRAPTGIENVDDRLRSRFEGGLVIELEDLDAGGVAPAAGEATATPAQEAGDGPQGGAGGGGEAVAPEEAPSSEPAAGRAASATDPPAPGTPAAEQGAGDADPASSGGEPEAAGRFSTENVIWEWPSLDDRIVDD